MLVYVVTARFAHDDVDYRMLVYHYGSKKEVEAQVAADGWKVKRVRQATSDDVSEVPEYAAVLKHARAELQRKQEANAEAARSRDALAQSLLEQAEQKKRERERSAQATRDLAISKAAGDIFDVSLEPGLKGNARIASLCAKTALFFNQASVNKKDLFTAISIDFAEFESQTSFPCANRLVSALLSELNEFLKIDGGIADMRQRLFADKVSVENKVNSIGSRSHIFGGSGDGLLISALMADSAVRQDRKEIERLQRGHVQRGEQARRAVELAELRQQLLEFRAKAAVSMLLAACGKSDTIEIGMSPAVVQYVLGMGMT